MIYILHRILVYNKQSHFFRSNSNYVYYQNLKNVSHAKQFLILGQKITFQKSRLLSTGTYLVVCRKS